MKTVITIACVSIATTCFSQKVKVDSEFDKFTKQKRVTGSVNGIRHSLLEYLNAQLRSVDTTYFLKLTGNGAGVGVIGSGDQVIFLFEDESTVTVNSTGVQSYELGSKYTSPYYSHQYNITLNDIEKLSQKKLKSIRKYYENKYTDIDVPEKRSGYLMELATAFLKELSKEESH